MDKIPPKFYEALRSKECILFIGSGISVWSGLPTWYELITKLLNFLEESGISSSDRKEIEENLETDLIEAASISHFFLRPENFREFLDDIFIKPRPKPHLIHDIIVTLGPDCFITTNYDYLIDDAYQKSHSNKLFQINNNQPIEQARILRYGINEFIFTPHGRAENSETVIFTKKDYSKLRTIFVPTLDTLQHLLISRPVIFLGFGLKDPDFIAIKDEIGNLYKGGEREHFAIMPDVGALKKKILKENYGITVISYETIINTSSHSNGVQRTEERHKNFLKLLSEIQQVIKDTQTPPKLDPHGNANNFELAKNSLIRYCEDLFHGYSNLAKINFELYFKEIKSVSSGVQFKDNIFSRLNINPERISSNDLFNCPLNFIILGSPGSGKTYSVKQFSKKLAEDAINNLKNEQIKSYSDIRQTIPLILPMKEYGGDIKEMISSQLLRSIDVNQALENGIFILIFDGVNEVSRDLITNKVLENNLSWLKNQYPNNRFIFTSRSKNYLSFLDNPTIIELKPIDYFQIHNILKNNANILIQSESENIINILTNPFFLTIYLKAIKSESRPILNITTLLSQYFNEIEKDLKAKNLLFDIPLMEILPPIAFKIIENGVQGIQHDEVLKIIQTSIHDNCHKESVDSERLLQNLIINGVVIPDSNGNLGFFHQTLLEFLAAKALVQQYRIDSTIIDNKITLLRWDETIILFVGLLCDSESILVLNDIAKMDIVFACKAFDTSVNHDEQFGKFLFNWIIDKINQKDKTYTEKSSLANGLKYVATYGSIQEIITLLDDEEIAYLIAPILAKLGCKESIPKIIRLLKKDNFSPSHFGQALSVLIDESFIPQLIQLYFERDDKSLLPDNIIRLLADFKNCQLLDDQIEKFIKSSNKNEKILAIRLLPYTSNDRCNYHFNDILQNSENKFKEELLETFSYIHYDLLIIDSEIIKNLFDLLTDSKIGSDVAELLISLKKSQIIEEANKRLETSQNDFEIINLCSVIAKSNPETAKIILFRYLSAFNIEYYRVLHKALKHLDKNELIPSLFPYILQKDEKLQQLAILSLRRVLRFDEQIEISDEICVQFIDLFEEKTSKFINGGASEYYIYSDIGSILVDNCASISKPYFISKINDSEYPHRDRIIHYVSRLPLQKTDFSNATISWLYDQLQIELPDYRSYYSSAGEILGKILNESDLSVLLDRYEEADNTILKNNILFTIQQIEKKIGKRICSL